MLKIHQSIVKDRVDVISNMSPVEKYILQQAIGHNLLYSDLLYATHTNLTNYRENTDLEHFYASMVTNSSEKLWHEAYYTALFAKTYFWEKWPNHIPDMKDVEAVRIAMENLN